MKTNACFAGTALAGLILAAAVVSLPGQQPALPPPAAMPATPFPVSPVSPPPLIPVSPVSPPPLIPVSPVSPPPLIPVSPVTNMQIIPVPPVTNTQIIPVPPDLVARLNSHVQVVLRTQKLPADLRVHLTEITAKNEQLRSLDLLHKMISERWQSPPAASTVEQHIAALLNATGDATLTTNVQDSLALKARHEGYTQLAEQLSLPGHTTGNLRDMKKAISRNDESAAGGYSSKKEPRPPKGVVISGKDGRVPGSRTEKSQGPSVSPEPMKPEAPRNGTRPRPDGKGTDGLPPHEDEREPTAGPQSKNSQGEQSERSEEKRHAPEPQLGDPVAMPLTQHISDYMDDLRVQVDILRANRQDAPEGEAEQGDPQERATAAVAKLLRRRLRPSEQILVFYMRRHGKGPADMAKILSDLEKPGATP
jgi:hypothetical protein